MKPLRLALLAGVLVALPIVIARRRRRATEPKHAYQQAPGAEEPAPTVIPEPAEA